MARKAAAVARRPVGRPRGGGNAEKHVPVLVQLRRDQREALREKAMERANTSGRVDVSSVLRDLIDKGLGLPASD